MHTNAVKQESAVTLEEIRMLVQNDLPPLPEMPEKKHLGELAKTLQWLAQAQGKSAPSLRHPRLAVFTTQADYTVPPMLEPLAEEINADLKVYQLTAESTGEQLTDHETAQALAYGMMAVQPGVDLVVVIADKDTGIDTSAAAGCIIAARLARIPVLLEGTGARTAAAFLKSLHPASVDHCRNTNDILPQKTELPAGAAAAMGVSLLKSLVRAG